jgi:hypothetical protein
MTKSKKGRIPIDELLVYWNDISKKPTLTPDDLELFFDRAKATMAYFSETYPRMMSENFFTSISVLPLFKDRAIEDAAERKRLANPQHVTMKDVARKFIPRIKKYFGADIAVAIDSKTPLQDAETILASSAKLTYRWAAGIIASNHLSRLLIQLSEETNTDDIMTLYDRLKNKTKNQKLKMFLTRSYQRFKDAEKVRNRCAHLIQGEATKQEIEQSIALARLLQKHVPRPSRKTALGSAARRKG